MKLSHTQSVMLCIFVIFASFIHQKPTLAIPLRPGTYYGGGSRYIGIHQKGNRICYSSLSKNGSTVASVEPDSSRQNTYIIHNFGANLVQKNENTLLLGEPGRYSEYSLESPTNFVDGDSILEQCLNSNSPFFHQKQGGIREN